ncbi:MAG: MaoC family dehydratase [Ilumatobacteraceae bacterium]|nr:MaoC family dehydratase [Ilumatobacteraceae bacterium]
MSDRPTTWVVRARNLPEHADNPIHTDAGARAEGFPSALVAGVTTYAYLTRPLAAAWGIDWLSRGGGEVRFRAPVFADAEVQCVPTPADSGDDGAVLVEAVCPDQERNPRATFAAVRDSGAPPAMRAGEALASRRFTLGHEFAADYAERAGDDLGIYRELRIVHPVTWLQIGNRVFSTDLVDGAWIHTRSVVRHHAPGPLGATVDVHATVVDRFERGGTRAVVDILVEHDGRPIVTLEHEAIVDLSTAD